MIRPFRFVSVVLLLLTSSLVVAEEHSSIATLIPSDHQLVSVVVDSVETTEGWAPPARNVDLWCKNTEGSERIILKRTKLLSVRKRQNPTDYLVSLLVPNSHVPQFESAKRPCQSFSLRFTKEIQ